MDWNDDGYDDIIVGDGYGYINYFERNSNGSLKAGTKLLCNGSNIDVGENSSPDFIDWDNDGDLDMIVGSDRTTPVRIYMNTGSRAAYKFTGYTEFKAGGRVVTCYRSMPSIFDMNNDGLFDIVIGSNDKKFHYFENTGKQGKPSFAADNPLRYQNGGYVVTDNPDCRLDIDDWNEDGSADLITGDYGDYVYLFTAQSVSIENNTEEIIAPAALSMITNPVKSDLSVLINTGEETVSDFTVYNMHGRVELTFTSGLLNNGYNTVTIPNNLSSGTYVLHCTAGNTKLIERFVVTR